MPNEAETRLDDARLEAIDAGVSYVPVDAAYDDPKVRYESFETAIDRLITVARAEAEARVEALEAALRTLHAHVARQSDHLLLGTRSEQMLDNVQTNLRAANDDAAQFLPATEQGAPDG